VSAEHLYEQCYYALHDERVALRSECYHVAVVVGLQPHTALAAVYQVLFRLVTLVQRLEVVAQVDEHLIPVHPVGESGKLLYHLVLCFIYCHCLVYVYVCLLL